MTQALIQRLNAAASHGLCTLSKRGAALVRLNHVRCWAAVSGPGMLLLSAYLLATLLLAAQVWLLHPRVWLVQVLLYSFFLLSCAITARLVFLSFRTARAAESEPVPDSHAVVPAIAAEPPTPLNADAATQPAEATGTTHCSVSPAQLAHALQAGHMLLLYQPIYSSSGELVAAEALVRLNDPDRGVIGPGEFIPVAEQTELIFPLSDWVLHSACCQMATWCAQGIGIQRIAVNISVTQVCHEDFPQTVMRTLQECGLDAHRLELEVTESALACNFDAVNNNLQQLRQAGVRISIDDFGTGYSSLSRVRDLQADVLKIDRLFVQETSTSKGSAMVQAIITMAHTLQLAVIAEGIETREQMNILRRLECDEMQGFLLSRPRLAKSLTEELQRSAGRHMPKVALSVPNLNPLPQGPWQQETLR